MIYEVAETKRDFAIGDTWAARLGPPFPLVGAPADCIVCGALQNSCGGEAHEQAASQEPQAQQQDA